MKLYGYMIESFLEKTRFEERVLTVEEKPKTYKVVDGKDFRHNQSVKKEDVGVVILKYGVSMFIYLTEPDVSYAKAILQKELQSILERERESFKAKEEKLLSMMEYYLKTTD